MKSIWEGWKASRFKDKENKVPKHQGKGENGVSGNCIPFLDKDNIDDSYNSFFLQEAINNLEKENKLDMS